MPLLNYTRQEVFDIVSQHLFKQGERSIVILNDYHSICAYRGNNGMKCAAGILIPDDIYKPSMEGYAVSCSGIRQLFPNNVIELLSNLQRTHDSIDCWDSPIFLKKVLRNIADEYHLNSSILTDLKFPERKST